MTDGGFPDDPAWLDALVARSPLLPDAGLRRHWRTVLPWLETPARYELAATLRWVEQALACLADEPTASDQCR